LKTKTTSVAEIRTYQPTSLPHSIAL
jgi:hypothetical protein